VSQEWLPPDPQAPQHPAPLPPAANPSFAPPTAAYGRASGRQGEKATAAIGLGAAGLGLLAFTAGALFFLTVPLSVAGWLLGRQASARGSAQGRTAIVLGIVGTILGVIAAIVWIAIYAAGGDVTVNDNGNLQVQTVLVLTG
jgi:hypothetical protein